MVPWPWSWLARPVHAAMPSRQTDASLEAKHKSMCPTMYEHEAESPTRSMAISTGSMACCGRGRHRPSACGAWEPAAGDLRGPSQYGQPAGLRQALAWSCSSSAFQAVETSKLRMSGWLLNAARVRECASPLALAQAMHHACTSKIAQGRPPKVPGSSSGIRRPRCRTSTDNQVTLAEHQHLQRGAMWSCRANINFL